MDQHEADFHASVERFLEALFEQLEDQDDDGVLDIDLQDGVLVVEASGHELAVTRHAPSQQVWLSSPLSGGLHFSPADHGRDWKLPDGRRLSVVLGEELSMITGSDFSVRV